MEKLMDESENEDMFNEAAGFIAENYPRALRLFYNRCVTEGFTVEQTMSLVTKYFELLLSNAMPNGNDNPTHDSESDSDFNFGE